MKYLPYALVAVLLFASYLQYTDREALIEQVATEKQKVRDRESDISVLKIDKENLHAEKVQLLGDIDKLNVEILKSKAIIEKIKKERDEKIKYVDDIPSGQLQGYFTKRYNSGKAK